MVRVRRVNILLEGEYISSFSNCISLMIIQVCVCICSGTWHHESWCSTNGEGVSGHNDHHPRGEISLRLGDWGIHTSVTCALQLIQTRYIRDLDLQFTKKIRRLRRYDKKLIWTTCSRLQSYRTSYHSCLHIRNADTSVLNTKPHHYFHVEFFP